MEVVRHAGENNLYWLPTMIQYDSLSYPTPETASSRQINMHVSENNILSKQSGSLHDRRSLDINLPLPISATCSFSFLICTITVEILNLKYFVARYNWEILQLLATFMRTVSL